MEISVRQTNIQPRLIKTLITHGIVLVSHLNKFDTVRLSQKTKLSLVDCENILLAIKPKRPHHTIKGSELLRRPFGRISTLNPELDSALNGGIRFGQITEISGEAGVGKSNMCAEIGTKVMLPISHGGLDGHVLLIHTEGEGKLKLACKRFESLASSVNREYLIGTKLHVMNCTNEYELTEMISRLPSVLDSKKTVKLIIIDSITCAFIATDERLDFEFYNKRSLALTKLVKTLTCIAWDRNIAIIVTNHVSYNFKWGENRPALGKTWSHMCPARIYLERQGEKRLATVTKGAFKGFKRSDFTISGQLHLVSDEIQN